MLSQCLSLFASSTSTAIACMLVEGIQQRQKGRKSAYNDRQAWWCEAPPRVAPLADREARERAQLEAVLRHQAVIDRMTM